MTNRLDVYLVSSGLVTSRSKAKMLIDNANVAVNGVITKKSSQLVSYDDDIQLIGENLKYVSRGGIKLEKALMIFNITLDHYICADIGASTGGFTDCMLQNNAKRVYAIDVGSNQLVDSIRSNNRVISLESTNIRLFDTNRITDKIDFIATDVSFISITLISSVIFRLLAVNGSAVFLIKPQFEAGKQHVGKKGVVKGVKIHKSVIKNVMENLSNTGFCFYGLDYSPVKGPNGNIEYLLYAGKSKAENNIDIDEIIKLAHKNL